MRIPRAEGMQALRTGREVGQSLLRIEERLLVKKQLQGPGELRDQRFLAQPARPLIRATFQ
jgi:hypothetical protein